MVMKKQSLLNYLLIVVVLTVTFGVIYASVQQCYRTEADDPQIQLDGDIDLKMQQGRSIERYFDDTIVIPQSVAPFVTLYDIKGNPLRSSGILDGKMPVLPAGIFDFTKSHGRHDVTWQPRQGIRIAMVVESAHTSPVGFIAAGRSLAEVEEREHNLETLIFCGWIICLGVLLLYALLQFYRDREKR
jgi:hypothetical protein